MNPSARTMASSVPSLDFVGDHYVMGLSSSRSFQCDSTVQGALMRWGWGGAQGHADGFRLGLSTHL